MRNIFSVAWLTPVLSVVVVIILVFSSFVLLKISNSNKRQPQELLTGLDISGARRACSAYTLSSRPRSAQCAERRYIVIVAQPRDHPL
jgi:hypothetical protein